MDEKIGLIVIKDLQPISFVEDEGFRDLIHTIDPDYVIPGRNHLVKKYLPFANISLFRAMFQSFDVSVF